MSAANLTGGDITPSAFPHAVSEARCAVACAMLAPSSHNTLANVDA